MIVEVDGKKYLTLSADEVRKVREQAIDLEAAQGEIAELKLQVEKYVQLVEAAQKAANASDEIAKLEASRADLAEKLLKAEHELRLKSEQVRKPRGGLLSRLIGLIF